MRWLFRLIVAFFCLIGVLVVAAVVLAVFATRELPAPTAAVPDRAVLQFNLADGLVETRPRNLLARAASYKAVVLRDLVRALEAAAGDPRVKGVLFHLGSGSIGLAQAQEIRDAVLDFRKSGKFAVAFAESFGEGGGGNLHYYLATAFDEIWMQPSGELALTGVLVETPFLRDTLDLLGVVPRIDKREEYKGGADMFTASTMPEPVRENLQRLVDSFGTQLATGISQGRSMTIEQARDLIDRGPYVAVQAQQQRLVDRLAYWDEVRQSVEDRGGGGAELLPIADYIAALPDPPADAPRIAVVYGLGPVRLATSEREPDFGDSVMRSRAVAAALADAVKDDRVKAIVFRIDSPGGSYVAADSIWREVDRARGQGKPVVVSMGNVAASGGYFVAAPAKTIVAEPGTITGSIGVFGGKFVLQGLWDKLGLRWDGVQSGRHAGFASPNRDYSEEEWAALQESLDRVYLDFTRKVAEGRSLPADKVEAAAKGQVWSGADAQAEGLVDQLGGFREALRIARTEAGIAPDAAVRVVEFPEARSDIDALLDWLSRLGLVDARTLRSLADLARLAGLADTLDRLLGPAAAIGADARLQAPALEVR
ncbi:MAG: signal peptide peptidase SppA [Rhodospirillaceae bacterium]|nr:signal peptide peptidase SppA [Rhodospirillaceae bacterium]